MNDRFAIWAGLGNSRDLVAHSKLVMPFVDFGRHDSIFAEKREATQIIQFGIRGGVGSPGPDRVTDQTKV